MKYPYGKDVYHKTLGVKTIHTEAEELELSDEWLESPGMFKDEDHIEYVKPIKKLSVKQAQEISESQLSESLDHELGKVKPKKKGK